MPEAFGVLCWFIVGVSDDPVCRSEFVAERRLLLAATTAHTEDQRCSGLRQQQMVSRKFHVDSFL